MIVNFIFSIMIIYLRYMPNTKSIKIIYEYAFQEGTLPAYSLNISVK